MGFFKDVFEKAVDIIPAPVTAPLKVSSNVIREVGQAAGFEQISAPLSTLAAAPWDATAGNKGFAGVLPGVISSYQQLQPLATAVGGAVASGGITSSSVLDALKGFTGTPPGKLTGAVNEQPSAIDGQVGGAPMLARPDYTMPLVLGAGGLLLFFMLRR